MGSVSNQLAGAAAVSWPATFLPRKSYSLTTRKCGELRVSCDHSCFEVCNLRYQPPGTKVNLLDGVNLSLRENSLGLIYGRSGSGKTTLLQLIAGFSKPTAGSIYVQRYGDDGLPNKFPEILDSNKVGFVFQFPERYFVAESILDEVTFGWPRQNGDSQLKELLALRLQKAFASVGLIGIPLDQDPQSLSGGYKRRLALAIQLVQAPNLLLLDEPLAGLDWKARADVIKLLNNLKKELSLLVVSHDLKVDAIGRSIVEDGDGGNTYTRAPTSLGFLCVLPAWAIWYAKGSGTIGGETVSSVLTEGMVSRMMNPVSGLACLFVALAEATMKC